MGVRGEGGGSYSVTFEAKMAYAAVEWLPKLLLRLSTTLGVGKGQDESEDESEAEG